MAVVAIVATVNVRRVFASRNNAVVAIAARTDHLRVIYGVDGREYVGRMAVLANVSGLYMRCVLTCCISAIMTIDAVAGYIHMVKVCG